MEFFFPCQDPLELMFSMKYLIVFKINTNISDIVKTGEGKSVITNLDQINIVYTNSRERRFSRIE